MFESLILPASAPTGGALRPLEWSELVARFSAGRDLRALVSRPGDSGASFAGRAKVGLHHDQIGERPVNLDALGGVKPLAAISAATVANVAGGDQGTQ